MIEEYTGKKIVSHLDFSPTLDEIESIKPAAIDWKLKLMQVLDAVGQAEGIWFEPWTGVSAEEQAEIEKEYAVYEATKTHSG